MSPLATLTSDDRAHVVRASFFAVVSWDALWTFAAAPRSRADGFVMAHLPLLDAVAPTPATTVVVSIALAIISAWIALGGAPRIAGVVVAASFTYLWCTSQADSYQHHVFVLVVLWIFAAVDWRNPTRSAWLFDLVLIQVAFVYGWAAYWKLEPRFLDGSVLLHQVDATNTLVVALSNVLPGWPPVLAIAALLVELAIVPCLMAARLRPAAFVLASFFHAGVWILGLEVGRFHLFMLAFAPLVLPSLARMRTFASVSSSRWMNRARALVAPVSLWRSWRAALRMAIASIAVFSGVRFAGFLDVHDEMAAEVALRQSDPASATAALARVAARHRDNVELHRELAQLAMRAGEMGVAAEALERVAGATGDDADLRMARAARAAARQSRSANPDP